MKNPLLLSVLNKLGVCYFLKYKDTIDVPVVLTLMIGRWSKLKHKMKIKIMKLSGYSFIDANTGVFSDIPKVVEGGRHQSLKDTVFYKGVDYQ